MTAVDGPAVREPASTERRDVVPILMYHSIRDRAADSMRDWTHSPSLLRSHMEVLTDGGYETLTVSQYLAARRGTRPMPPRPVLVTFDDGFRDFATNAVPVLADTAVRATVFVTSAYIGGTSDWLPPDAHLPMMSRAELAELPGDLVEVGAHGRTHAQLDVVPHSAARDEIRRSKAEVEDAIGRPVTTFAYPHGYHDARVRRLVQVAGFDGACAVRHALSWSGDDPYALARVIVAPDLHPHELSAVLRGASLRRAPSREELRTKAWRVVRRVRALVGSVRP